MWEQRLQDVYDGNYQDWKDCSDMYGLCERLGYDDVLEAWTENPMVRGSVDPQDYKVAS